MLLRKTVIKLAKEKFLKDFPFNQSFSDIYGVSFSITFYKPNQKSLLSLLERFYALCVYIEDSFVLDDIQLKKKGEKVEYLTFSFIKSDLRKSCLKDFLIRYFWNLMDSFLLKDKEIFLFEVSKHIGVNGPFYRFYLGYNGICWDNHVDLFLPDSPDLIFIASLLSIISCKRGRFLEELKFSKEKIKELRGLLGKKDLKELYTILELIFDNVVR